MNRKLSDFALLSLLFLSPATAFATPEYEWPTWSGPNRNLMAQAEGIFSRPTFGLETAWSRDLGSGYSGIVIAGERMITAFSDGTDDVLAAFDAKTGREIWRYRIAPTYGGHDGSDDGPLGTPSVEDGKVFALGPLGQLFALKLKDGRHLWSTHIEKEHGARPPHYGFTTQPTVIDGVLVVQTGGADGQAISGFDPQTGKLLWSAEDATVSYQSPLAFQIGGKVQALVATNEFIAGLEPKTGKRLWKHEYGEQSMGDHSRPIPLGEGNFLLTSMPHSTLFQVTAKGEEFHAQEVWQSRRLRGTFAAPVPYRGHLYGYAGGILSCVDAATGDMVWRSRQPGAGYLILVDGNLVIQTDAGEMVVAEATPKGYREKTRAPALEHGYYSQPSFADGRVFVRNLEQLVSLGVTDTPQATVSTSQVTQHEPLGMMADFAAQVASADNKEQLVEEFIGSQKSFPILEGDRLVHFVFRGEVEDLVLSGNFLSQNNVAMERLPGTDFYFYSVELEPASHYIYSFAEFDERKLDPFNPRTAIGGRAEQSELTTAGWKRPAHLAEPSGERGHLEEYTWESNILEGEHEVQIYLPHNYKTSGERYPVLVVNSGNHMLTRTSVQASLDNLIASGEAPPLIAVFVPWMPLDDKTPEYAEALAEEMLKYLDTNYRTLTKAQNRGILGVSGASFHALYTAFLRPDVFGGAAVQTIYFGNQADQFKEKIADSPRRDLKFYVAIAKFDNETSKKASREVVDLLREHGYPVQVDEVGDGTGWTSWGSRVDRMLKTLFK